ncbi:MAG TPA: hypothetical protein VFK44_04870 [Bacillales bacterium]|nr:hypothetical protein [Bacillales bacterium]
MFRSGIKWLFLIMGTTIGAGYASGREIWQFFGPDSLLAIPLFALLFSICVFVIMTISYEQKSVHYIPILRILLGKKLTSMYDAMIVVYLFSTTVIMLAGGGASLEMLNVPYWIGILIISMLVVGLFLWDIRGMLSMNMVLIPVLVTLLVIVLGTFFFSGPNRTTLSWNMSEKWPAALTFTAFNILGLLAVLAGIGSQIKQKGEIWIASIGSGILLGAISLLYNESLVKVGNDVMVLYEIPLFAILKHYPYSMIVLMSALLWSAIYTTAVSGVFGLISRMSDVIDWPMWLFAFVIVVMMVPLTKFGFANLIAVLYPIYGVLNLYVLASILIYPLVKRYRLS